MKPFIVVKHHNNNTVQLYFASPDTGRNHMCLKIEQNGSECNHDEFEIEQDFYFCDSEADAEALALYLLARFPQYTWAVAKTSLVVSRPPGDVTRARYSDKGLLPA